MKHTYKTTATTDNQSNPKFAAIDIGSNAARLLLASVFEHDGNWIVNRASLLRMPVRLGDDAFLTGRISDRKTTRLLNTILGFKYLMEAFTPVAYMACATSAMREAQNGPDLCNELFEKSGIQINIIDGKREAEIILENSRQKINNQNLNVLFVDVGGGSTEITLLSEGCIISSHSFSIGSIKLSNNLVSKDEWKRMKQWLTRTAAGRKSLTSIGSGGNIKTIFGIADVKYGKPISRRKIIKVQRFLNDFTLEDRITMLGLKPDRADVIVPASEIYLNVMKWSGTDEMHVPMLGLADGMVHVMYKKYKNG